MCLLFLIPGCTQPDAYTGVRIRAQFTATLLVDQLRVSGARLDQPGVVAFEPQQVPSPPRPIKPNEDLVILLNAALAGQKIAVRVDALANGSLVGSAGAVVLVVSGQLTDAELPVTEPALCGDGRKHATAEECDDGNTRSGDGCSASCGNEGGVSRCGDNKCDGGETRLSCPSDCGASMPQSVGCGDGTCSAGEDSCNCEKDCGAGSCGDAVCCPQKGENTCSCPIDCGAQTCGDGTCCASIGEDVCNCATDCGETTCGDGLCCNGESCGTDCGDIATCGNGTCESGEDGCVCPGDCGGSRCGDGICCPNAGEGSCTCAADCGAATCGDGVCCAGQESRCTCQSDCGAPGTEGPQGDPTCSDGIDNDCDNVSDAFDADCWCFGSCCDRTCTDSCEVSCESSDCECAINCENNPEKCEVDCKSGATCRLNCRGAQKCDVSCQDSSICHVDCSGAKDCRPVQCSGSSTCYIDCRGAENCSDVQCSEFAWCYLQCDSDHCGCSGGQLCQDGTIACNGAPCQF